MWCAWYGGIHASFGALDCSSQFQRHSKGPEEASFILSRATEGKWVLPDTNGVPMWGDSKRFNQRSDSPIPFVLLFCCSLPRSGFSRNQKYRIIPLPLSVLCTTQMDVLFLPDAHFVEMKAGSKIQSFHLSLIIFFIMISVLMNPTTEHGNGTSF